MDAFQTDAHGTAFADYREVCARMPAIIRGDNDATAIRAAERLAKRWGWDKPSHIQQEDVTPAKHDLSALTNGELAALERLLVKADGKNRLSTGLVGRTFA